MDTITIVAIVVSVYVVSGIIVAVDNKHYDWGIDSRSDLGLFFVPVVFALALSGLTWWLYTTDYPFFDTVTKMVSGWVNDPFTFFPFTLIEVVIYVIIGIILDILIAVLHVGTPIAAVALIGGSLFQLIVALPKILPLPFVAFAPIMRGVAAISSLPVLFSSWVHYLFNKPPALETMEQVTRASDAQPDEVKQAGDALKKEFEEVRNPTGKKRSSATLNAYAKHHKTFTQKLSARQARAFAEYNREVRRAAEGIRTEIEQRFRTHRGKGHEKEK